MIKEEYNAFKSKRVMVVGCDAEERSFRYLFLPFERARLEMYEKTDGPFTGVDNVVHIHDLEQNPGKRPRSSPVLPTGRCLMPSLISHGTLWNGVKDRCLLTLEWGSTQGYPTILSQCSIKSPVYSRQLLAKGAISHAAMRQLFGLGWHLPSIGSWLMFLLSSVEFLPFVMRIVSPLKRLQCSTEQYVKRHCRSRCQPSVVMADSPETYYDCGDSTTGGASAS